MIKSRKNFPVLLILTLALIALAMSVVALDGKEELRAKMEAQRAALTVTSARSADQPALKAAQADRPSISTLSPDFEAFQTALAAKAAGQADQSMRGGDGDKKWHGGVSAANVAPEKKPYDGSPNVPRPDNRRQGGEDIANAVIIPSVPYTNIGFTAGFFNDYDEACPYTGSTSPDVVYSYAPPSDMTVDISLCNAGTDYDTKLYLYEDSYTPGSYYACNDDACPGYISKITALDLFTGHTYYIVIDGYGGDYGNYEITISGFTPCVVECPPGGIDEGEPCIGDDEEDYTNGGCNSDPPVFGSIGCEETVCGEWNTYLYFGSSYRDTDWYTFTLTQYSNVTITAEGEFPIVTGFLEQVVPGGGWDCGNFTGYISPYATGNACDVVIVSQIMAPGDYAIFVGGTVFSGYDCASGPFDYTVSVTCEAITEGACCYEDGSCVPDMEEAACFTSGGTSWLGGIGCSPNLCPQPGPENDDCADATPIGEVVDLPFCTDAANYDGPSSCQSAPNIWYCYTAGETGNATISLCGSGYDTYLGVYQGCECVGPVIICNDDACGLQSEVEIPVTAGNQYLIEIGGYGSNVGCGILNIYVSPPCVVECPPGSSEEGEDCGDDTNGGCNSVPPVFGSIDCGETVCGNAWAEGGTRDTDWYQLVLTEWVSATWTVTAEFDVVIGLVEQDPPGAGDCAYSTGYLVPYAVGADCEEISVSVILGPGSHWFFVAPNDFYVFPCAGGPWDYVASLTCESITEGACCYEDGSCVPGMAEADCYASDGLDWFGGVSCDPDPCPCYYDCPPGATPEGEVCLEDDAIDDTNGGCNSVPNVFGSLSCGETICGEWSTYLVGGSSQYRDTDWYQLDLDDWYTVTLNAEGGFPLVFGFIEQIVPGVPGCDNITGYIAPYAVANPCTPASVQAILGPGTYYVFVGGQVYTGYPCATGPWQYEITATCVPAEETYCPASGGCDEYIAQVQVGTINNASGCSGYADYTSLCTEMAPETGYPITITIGNAYSLDTGAVWVDWNQDLDFDDAGEAQPLTVGFGYGPYTGTITPPIDALAGDTRMRIRMTYNTTPTPCGSHTYGEVEDYCISVGGVAPPTCAFAPDPTLTLTKFAINYVEGAVYFTGAAVGGDLNDVTLDYLQPQGSACTVPFDDYEIVPGGYGDLPGPVGKGTFDLRAYVVCEEEDGLVWGPVESFFDVYYELDLTPGSFGCSVDLMGHISGDLNLDGNANIADLTFMVSYLFRGGPAPQVMQVADVNGSGGPANISDLTYFVDYLFRGGPTPRHQ